jgi:hypothetical protein
VSRRQRIFVLPPGVNLEDIDWRPNAEDIAHERWLREKAEFERNWLIEAQKKLALIARLVEQDKREQQLEEWHQRRETFYREQAEKQSAEDQRQIARYLTEMQTALDKPALDALKARLERAAREIKSTDAYIEREELKRRGVVRGTR